MSRGLPSTDSGLPGSSKLLSWVPGRGLDHHRADIGKRLPAGKYINWQLHYNPTGKPETDRSSFGVWFQKGKLEKELFTRPIGDAFIVEVLTGDARGAIHWLEELGVEFTQDNGGYRLARCGGARLDRLHACGEARLVGARVGPTGGGDLHQHLTAR